MAEARRALWISMLGPLAVAGAVLASSTGMVVARAGDPAPVRQGEVVAAPDASAVPKPTVEPVPTAPPVTKASFIAKAESICTRMNEIEDDFEAPTLDGIADNAAKARDSLVKGIDELLALVPPMADVAHVEKIFFAPLRDAKTMMTTLFGQLEKALREGDLLALQNLGNVGMYGPNLTDPTPQLIAYGFHACADGLSEDAPAQPAAPNATFSA